MPKKENKKSKRRMNKNDQVEEGLRDEVWKEERDGRRVSTVSGAIPQGLQMTVSQMILQRTCTMPHKNDCYCFAVPVPLIVERSFSNCPRDAAR